MTRMLCLVILGMVATAVTAQQCEISNSTPKCCNPVDASVSVLFYEKSFKGDGCMESEYVGGKLHQKLSLNNVVMMEMTDSPRGGASTCRPITEAFKSEFNVPSWIPAKGCVKYRENSSAQKGCADFYVKIFFFEKTINGGCYDFTQ